MNVPEKLKYSSDHEWIRMDDSEALIGITDFAQGELGDIIFVEFPSVGEKYSAGDPFGTVEAVKTVADLYMPVGGEILEINTALDDAPETVNQDPYQGGWLVKISVSAPADFDGLMDAERYKAHIS